VINQLGHSLHTPPQANLYLTFLILIAPIK
jgi:hypothetical protein